MTGAEDDTDDDLGVDDGDDYDSGGDHDNSNDFHDDSNDSGVDADDEDDPVVNDEDDLYTFMCSLDMCFIFFFSFFFKANCLLFPIYFNNYA